MGSHTKHRGRSTHSTEAGAVVLMLRCPTDLRPNMTGQAAAAGKMQQIVWEWPPFNAGTVFRDTVTARQGTGGTLLQFYTAKHAASGSEDT